MVMSQEYWSGLFVIVPHVLQAKCYQNVKLSVYTQNMELETQLCCLETVCF
jgi:hypothetical protein